jgi:hypothetical protein
MPGEPSGDDAGLPLLPAARGVVPPPIPTNPVPTRRVVARDRFDDAPTVMATPARPGYPRGTHPPWIGLSYIGRRDEDGSGTVRPLILRVGDARQLAYTLWDACDKVDDGE